MQPGATRFVLQPQRCASSERARACLRAATSLQARQPALKRVGREQGVGTGKIREVQPCTAQTRRQRRGMLAPAALLTPRVVTHGTPTAPLPPCLRPLPRLRQQRLRPSQRI